MSPFANEIIQRGKEAFLRKLINQVLGHGENEPIEPQTIQNNFSFVYFTDMPDREFFAYHGDILGEIKLITEITETGGVTMTFQFLPGNPKLLKNEFTPQ